MALGRSGMILYVGKISYQSDSWFENCKGAQNFTQHTHWGPFYKSCFSAKLQKQD